MPEIIEALVDGGKASAGAPLGPALGPKGVNIMQVINTINDKTKQFQGMKVPVKIIIDPKTKEFTIEVGTPPAASLILREVGAIEGGAERPVTGAEPVVPARQGKTAACPDSRKPPAHATT